jgi:hypothetical protein
LADHSADSQDELDVDRCEAVKFIVDRTLTPQLRGSEAGLERAAPKRRPFLTASLEGD